MNNNPLRQYFRRPAVFIRLPSNYTSYTSDVLEVPETQELPVYPMTAIDEITVKTPDSLFNGSAITEIIKSCIPSIKNPWKLLSIDLDTILLATRIASNGDKMEIETVCPSCKEESKYDLSLMNMLTQIKSGNYNEELQIGDLFIKFRPLTFKELNDAGLKQFELQKVFNMINNIEDIDVKLQQSREALKSVTDLTMEFISKSIEYIRSPNGLVNDSEFILDYIRNCDKKTYELLKDRNTQLKDQSTIKPIDVTCMHCSHPYEQPFTINYSDFFE
jgi:hypothetical protein